MRYFKMCLELGDASESYTEGAASSVCGIAMFHLF